MRSGYPSGPPDERRTSDARGSRRLPGRRSRRCSSATRKPSGASIAGASTIPDAPRNWCRTFSSPSCKAPGATSRARRFALTCSGLPTTSCSPSGGASVRHRAEPLPDDLASAAPDADGALWVRRALATLQPDQREIVMLREYQGLSYLEIAHVMQLPLNTVRSRLFRARMDLRDALSRQLPIHQKVGHESR